MKNELFSIGPFTVYGYGLMIALGVMAAWIAAEYRARKLKMKDEHVFFWYSGVCWEDLCFQKSFSGSQNGRRSPQIRPFF